jgi:hypothetical protein
MEVFIVTGPPGWDVSQKVFLPGNRKGQGAGLLGPAGQHRGRDLS